MLTPAPPDLRRTLTGRLVPLRVAHRIADIRQRFGETCWTECTCGERIEAATPEALEDAWNAHRGGPRRKYRRPMAVPAGVLALGAPPKRSHRATRAARWMPS